MAVALMQSHQWVSM